MANPRRKATPGVKAGLWTLQCWRTQARSDFYGLNPPQHRQPQMQSGPQDYTTAWKNALSDIAGKNSEMHERSLAHAMACASIAAYSIVHYDPCIWRVLRGRIYGVIAWNSVLHAFWAKREDPALHSCRGIHAYGALLPRRGG